MADGIKKLSQASMLKTNSSDDLFTIKEPKHFGNTGRITIKSKSPLLSDRSIMDESDVTSSVKSSVLSSEKSIQLRRNERSKSLEAGEITDYNPISLVMLAMKDP